MSPPGPAPGVDDLGHHGSPQLPAQWSGAG